MPKVSETILQADMIRGPIPEESKLNTVCERIIQGWSSKDMKDKVLKVVYWQQSQANGSIHVGDIGELVATILILFIMDKVLNPENLRLMTFRHFSRPCYLQVLGSLFAFAKAQQEYFSMASRKPSAQPFSIVSGLCLRESG